MVALVLAVAVVADGPEMVMARYWVPAAGDRARTRRATFGAEDLARFHVVAKFRRAQDQVGVDEAIEQGRGVSVAAGTEVLVVRRYDYRPPARVIIHRDIEDAARQAIADSLTPPREYPPNALEVRILDGPLKDQLRFVPEDDVGHMVDVSEPREITLHGRGEPMTLRVVPSVVDFFRSTSDAGPERAAAVLARARRAERKGDLVTAAIAYHRLSRDLPKTEQGAAAARWLKDHRWNTDGFGTYQLDVRPSRRRK